MHHLREIAEQAVFAAAGNSETAISLDEIYRLLDVYGTANPHLKNPLNTYKDVGYFRPGQHPLTGDEPVHGRFLRLNYGAHDDAVLLFDCADSAILESQLLGGSGMLNAFTTFEYAFIDFQIARYRISYRLRDGSTSVFDKRKQDEYIRRNETFEDRKVEWITT